MTDTACCGDGPFDLAVIGAGSAGFSPFGMTCHVTSTGWKKSSVPVRRIVNVYGVSAASVS